MKRIFFFTLALSFFFSGCKKTRTCKCTETDKSNGLTVVFDSQFHNTKKGAEADCSKGNAAVANTVTECNVY